MSENLASNPILELTPQPVPALEPPPQPAVVELAAVPKPPKRAWRLPAAVAALGVLASGGLGGLLYVNTGQRDAARNQLAATRTQLASTRSELDTTTANLGSTQNALDAAGVRARYVSFYIADSGRTNTSVANFLNECTSTSYSSCRSDAQQILDDLKAFQADRSKLSVPTDLANADTMLKDSLSAAIAAVQEFITGADNGKADQIDDGWNKFEAARLSLAKAETALGAAIK